MSIEPPEYRRHRPESTLLYRFVAEHYLTFRDRRVAEQRPLPHYVEDEFAPASPDRAWVVPEMRAAAAGDGVSIEDPPVIARVLNHLRQRPETEPSRPPFASRAPPDPSPLL